MQIEIFRAGKRQDANGNEFDITVENLKQVVDGYDPACHEAPIVIGHPKMNTPAYAWVESLSLDGETLKANLKQIDPEFGELVKSGKYKKVSASFYTPESPTNPVKGAWSLRHVGFLGAMPPAVKGLKEPIFADDETGIALFTDAKDDGKDDVKDDSKDTQTKHSPCADAPNQPKGEVMTDDDKTALAAANARADAAEKALQDYKAQVAKEKETEAGIANANFAESLVKQGKIKPADSQLVAQMLGHLQFGKDETADFGEAPLTEAMKRFLEALPSRTQALTGDFATHTANFGEGMSHHERATALMKSEHITYEEAARRTAKG